jgi:prepilin-type processing-associated H-X9-DG protein
MVCHWNGGDNSFIAVRSSDTKKKVKMYHSNKTKTVTIVHLNYIYADGHVETGSWRK